jgi:hypothetical protein
MLSFFNWDSAYFLFQMGTLIYKVTVGIPMWLESYAGVLLKRGPGSEDPY